MKKRIIISLFALFIFLSAGTITAILYMASNASGLKNIIKLHEVEQLRRSLVISIQNVQSSLYTYNTPSASDLDFIVREAASLDKIAQKCSSCHHSPQLTERIENMQSLVIDYEDYLSYYLTASANPERTNKLKTEAAHVGQQLIVMAEAMSHSATRSLTDLSEDAMARVNNVMTILLITVAITFILGVIVAIHLAKSVTRPISELVEATGKISSGEFGSTISFHDQTEFGELAEHFNKMSLTIKDGYEKIQQEVAEKIQTEHALRESEDKFRTFFEMSPVGIVIYPIALDPLNRTLTSSVYNTAFHNFFGYSREELRQMSVAEITHPTDLRKNIVFMEELVAGKRDSYTMEKRYIKKGGDIFWGLINVTLLKSSYGKPPQVMTTLVDITERKLIESEQLKIEKLESVGILAGGIAHDFNNILTTIVNNISLAKLSTNPDNNTVEILSNMDEACRRAKDLTNQLLTFSKGGTPVKKIISIKEQIRDSSLFALRGSNINCKFFIAHDLWPVEIDAGQIDQVLYNLLINAVQAMPGGGTIFISAKNTRSETHTNEKTQKDYVKITIEDQGAGIPEGNLKNIFDPYFTTKQGGSGLGLACTYSIIKNHGGNIAVYSEDGKGAVFSIYLPAVHDQFIASEQREARIVGGSGKVLLLEDEDSVGETISRMLTQIGYDVVLTKDGSDAVTLYKEALTTSEPFDSVIMDLTIRGGMGGKDTMQHLRNIDPHIAAIVSSGYFNDPIMANYQDYGFIGVLPKPYDIEELSLLLNRVMSQVRK